MDDNSDYVTGTLATVLIDMMKNAPEPEIELYPISYREYLATEHWAQTRQRAIERAGKKCQLCGKRIGLDVHHNTYDSIWDEQDNDLIVLCRKCHSKFHDKEPGVVLWAQ